MQVKFHGAAGQVTGSMHCVEVGGKRILLDCGLMQGSREDELRNFEDFPFDPASIDAVILSHAHIDHIGRLPLLTDRGFKGPILAQEATAELLPIMLMDAASLQESDAERSNRKRRPGVPEVKALYTRESVARAMLQVRTLKYDVRMSVFPGIDLMYRDAGHILGSCSVELQGDGKTLVFSGDLGQKNAPILRDPEPVPFADLLLMESTYGNRLHKDREATVSELGRIFEAAARNGGNVLIPAFAVGRSQELLYWFAQHWEEWNLSRWKIVLDSPMAAKVVRVYDKYHAIFDEAAQKVMKGTPNPFRLPNLLITQTAEESKSVNALTSGAIIIAGSGMANGGRIVHHLRQNLERPQAHVVFVGYQAQGTLGRRLVDGAQWVRIDRANVRVNARIHTVGGLSAHADQAGLLDWYAGFKAPPPVVLVHGEDIAREALAGELALRYGVDVDLAYPGETTVV